MSPRVLVASAILAVLLGGAAIFILGPSGEKPRIISPAGDGSGLAGQRGLAGGGDGAAAVAGDGSAGAPSGDGIGARPGIPLGVGVAPGTGIDGEDPAPAGSGAAGSDPSDPASGAAARGAGARSGGGSHASSGSAGARETLVAGPSITLHGTVVVIDAGGARHSEESGRLSARIGAPGHDELREIAVVGGAWSAPVPAGARIRFESAMLAERPAQVTPEQAVTAAEGMRLELLARWTASTLLHVRSRETGEPLRELELLRIHDWLRNSRPHPGAILPTDQRRTAESSPFTLEPDVSGSVPYHVRAPGHAWGRILIDTASGGDREILLDPGGSLDLAFTGGWQAPGAVLRLRASGVPQPYAETALLGEAMRIDGVLPGTYEVSVETGNWAQEPRSLASAEVEVRAGEIAPVTLALPELVDEERVPFAGTLYIPETWDLDEFHLRIRPVDPGASASEETQDIPSLEMTASPVQGGILYGWEADAVHAGTYGVLVLPVGYGVNIAVGAEGEIEAAIALPEPVTVEVVAVLAGTSEPATPGVIRWTPARAAGVPGAGALAVPPVEGSANVFAFAAPIGDVIISSSDDAYRPASRQVAATLAGPNTFTLELEPAHGIHVRLFDGETPVPWDLGWHAHLTAQEGGTGQVVTRGRIGIEYRVLVSVPGWYTLTIPEIDGFLPVSPQPVEVLENQVIEVAVDLVREP